MWDLLSIVRSTSVGVPCLWEAWKPLIHQRNRTSYGVTAQAAHGGRDHVTGRHVLLSLGARQRFLRRDYTEAGLIHALDASERL